MNALQTISVADITAMGKAVVASGLFGIKKADEFIALGLIAQAEGRHPAIVARDYHIISGRPTLKADAILARFQEAGGKVRWVKLSDTEATATFIHEAGGSVEINWTLDMAKKAGLTNNPTWAKYPRAMLRARCVSEGVRSVFPAVLCGVYTPEEVSDMEYDDKKQAPAPAPVDTPCEVVPSPQEMLVARVKGVALNNAEAAELARYICGKFGVKKLSAMTDEQAKEIVYSVESYRSQMLFDKEVDAADAEAVNEETRDA